MTYDTNRNRSQNNYRRPYIGGQNVSHLITVSNVDQFSKFFNLIYVDFIKAFDCVQDSVRRSKQSLNDEQQQR